MRELLLQYFNIAFLMGKPQDLPVGRDQMKIGLMFALITYVAALAIPYGIPRAFLQAAIDFGCTALALHFALGQMGLSHRFEQAFGGFCGASAFINLAALPEYALKPIDAGAQTLSLTGFLLLVWGLSLCGHVIRHTFEVSLVVSIAASVVFFVLLSWIMFTILPMPDASSATVSNIGADLWPTVTLWPYG